MPSFQDGRGSCARQGALTCADLGCTTAAPELKAERLDQIAVLPLGARLVLHPWSSRLELIRNAAQLPGSARERVVPLAISPLIPYLKYVEAPPVFRP